MKIKNKLARIDVAGLTVTVKPKGTSWSINYRQDGKRVRKQVGTEEERDKLVAELRAKRNNLNEAEIHEARHGGAVALSRRTEADRTALLTALQVIEGAGGKPTDLLRAAERYVTTVLQVRKSVTLGTAVNAYTESKQNRRARTKSDIKCRLKQIVKHFGCRILNCLYFEINTFNIIVYAFHEGIKVFHPAYFILLSLCLVLSEGCVHFFSHLLVFLAESIHRFLYFEYKIFIFFDPVCE